MYTRTHTLTHTLCLFVVFGQAYMQTLPSSVLLIYHQCAEEIAHCQTIVSPLVPHDCHVRASMYCKDLCKYLFQSACISMCTTVWCVCLMINIYFVTKTVQGLYL